MGESRRRNTRWSTFVRRKLQLCALFVLHNTAGEMRSSAHKSEYRKEDRRLWAPTVKLR